VRARIVRARIWYSALLEIKRTNGCNPAALDPESRLSKYGEQES
jgi:hypothetical protein